VSPCYCLVQHVAVANLRAAEFGCRFRYLGLTSALWACVEAGYRRAVTPKTEVVIGLPVCHMLPHRGCNEAGHIRPPFFQTENLTMLGTKQQVSRKTFLEDSVIPSMISESGSTRKIEPLFADHPSPPSLAYEVTSHAARIADV
jgi:hypothetical protein